MNPQYPKVWTRGWIYGRLNNGMLPRFTSSAINNSTSKVQNYWVGHNGPLQWSPNSACAAVLESFIRLSEDYHYCVCLAPFANCQASWARHLLHTFIFFSSNNIHVVHTSNVNLNEQTNKMKRTNVLSSPLIHRCKDCVQTMVDYSAKLFMWRVRGSV